MPAHSKSQQKFMGMVHAAQKGDLKNPSPAVKKAADSISPDDAEDFASTKHKGLPNHVKENATMNPRLSLSSALPPQIATPVQQAPSMNQVLETIAQYNQLGQMLRRNSSMREVANKIAHIAEIAEQAVVNEADDWFDKHTVSRNMKEIKSYAKDFNKLALEADMMNQRMTALYDDMGRILERYFELPDGAADPNADPQQVANGMAHTHEMEPGRLQEAEVQDDADEEEDEFTSDDDSALPEPNIEPPRPVKEPESHQHKKVDPLTIKAIKVVHDYLKNKDPELARRFRALPAEKMKVCVWKLVR